MFLLPKPTFAPASAPEKRAFDRGAAAGAKKVEKQRVPIS